MAAPAPSRMDVYAGTIKLGEIDRGHSRVEAWLLVGDDLVSLGGHRDRTARMTAVSPRQCSAGRSSRRNGRTGCVSSRD